MRIAIVHDWLLGMRGGERCLEVVCRDYPQADIFTLFHDPRGVSPVINGQVRGASVLNRLPLSRRVYRYLFPFYPQGIASLNKQLRAGAYDLVISISHCAAKNIDSGAVEHLSYCLTPVRYLWDQYDAYFAGRPIEPVVRALLPKMRRWDIEGSRRVSRFAVISEFVRERVRRVYGLDSEVVYPPVRTDWINPRMEGEPGQGFLCANALVPYKNTHLVVEAFNRLGLPLTVVGTGPEERRLKSIAKSNIQFIGNVSDPRLADYYRRSKALIFSAEEDFGMMPVEMLAAGRPVIALGKGGAAETLTPETAVFFENPEIGEIEQAVRDFLDNEDRFKVEACKKRAAIFSLERFRLEFAEFIANRSRNALQAGAS
jgi:glycosyltransferase involved in cell wall biosynthesis